MKCCILIARGKRAPPGIFDADEEREGRRYEENIDDEA
jgi:hypothetical protein